MIAFLGGSFDPVHEGHIHLAQELLGIYQFDKIYFVPAKQNPLKKVKTVASGEMRVKMIRTAISELNEPRFEVLDTEIYRKGPSYTLLTLQELLKNGEKEIALLLGNEVFKELPQWHEPKQLLESAHCVVVNRNKEIPFRPIEILEKLHILDGKFLGENKITHTQTSRWIEQRFITPLPFSATEIRKQIKEQWNKNELQDLPPGIRRSVWLLIKENSLYTVSY